MSITRVQSNQNSSSTNVTSLAITLSSGVTLGNLLVVCLGYGAAANTVTLPDGSWQTAVDSPGATNEQSAEIYYLIVDAGHAGQTSWTFTISTSAKLELTIAEWSASAGWAASPVDQTATNTATSQSTTIDSGTTATTTQSEELWVAALSYGQSAQTESSLTSGWSFGQEAAVTSAHVLREVYQAVSSTGAADASFTIGTTEHWGGAVATFKTSSGSTVALSGTLAGVGTLTGTLSLATALTTTLAGVGTLASTLSLLSTALGLTVTKSGTPVSIKENSLSIPDQINKRSTASFVVEDLTGSLHFQWREQILITDSVAGDLFTGYVDSSREFNLFPNAAIEHTVICTDEHYKADKHYYNGPEYVNQYAGNIATDLLQNYLAPEGITDDYAIRHDSSQADFAAGTLTSVTATSNVDDGDLELSLAGSTVTKTETSTSDFNAGTLTNVVGSNGTLILTSQKTIKLVGYASQGYQDAYTYEQIWNGSQSIAAGDTLQYDVWISSTSPQIIAGVDGICTDNSSIRDFNSNAIKDQNGLLAHPKADLSGFANDQWYSRVLDLTQLAGKTLAQILIAFEGDNAGTYTAYFRNIRLLNSVGGVKVIFFDSNHPLGTVTQGGLIGYSGVSVAQVTAYDKTGTRISPNISINAVGIVRASFISWTTPVLPAGTALEVDTSIDGGATWQMATNHMPIASLMAGMKVTGRNLQTQQILSLTGTSPEVTPTLSAISLTVQPSYNATKSDVIHTDDTQANFNTGTLTDVLALSTGDLTLNGFFRNWDDANLANETLYGGSNAAMSVSAGQQAIRTDSGFDVRARLDFAGQWADFILEVDLNVDGGLGPVGINYRTTNWVNANDCVAYTIEMDITVLNLTRGPNAGTTGVRTVIGTVGLSLTAGNWHRLKVVVVGSNHKVYLDGVLLLTVTDATYTAQGYIGLRYYNNSGVRNSGFFDNFGVVSALTGNRKAAAVSIGAVGTVYTSIIQWNDDEPTGASLLVERSLDGGSTWAACTNGAEIPSLVNGYNASGKSLTVRTTFTSANASYTSVLHGITWWVLGQLNASGNRVSPVLSLTPVGMCGSSIVAWNANLPPNTALGVDVSYNGSTWTDVTGSNGGALPTINGQPDPTIDGFDANSSASYTSTNYASGANATWTWDTSNSRLTVSGGTTALLVWNSVSAADSVIEAIISTSESGGLIARYTGTTNFYFLQIRDGTSMTNPNTLSLSKRVAGTTTQIHGPSAISFLRGTYHVVRLSVIGTTLVATFDGVQIFSVTDSSLAGSGKTGLIQNGGSAIYYSLRMQPQGDSLAGKNVYTRARLSTTDPTATPQLLDITVAAHAPSISNGALVPSTNYSISNGGSNTIAACSDDLARRSDLWWSIKGGHYYFQGRKLITSPWVAQDGPASTVQFSTPPSVTRTSPLYRNRQWVQGGTDQEAAAQTFIGDGITQSWTLKYPVYSMTSISINDNPATIGVQGIDTDKDFYYQVGSQQIIQDASESSVANLVRVAVSYVATVPVFVMAEDTAQQAILAAIEGGTGIVEALEQDSTLNTAAATQLAQARIAQYAVLGIDFTFTTLLPGLAPGQFLPVFLGAHSIADVSALITKITTTAVTRDVNQLQPFYAVEATSGPHVQSWTQLFSV